MNKSTFIFVLLCYLCNWSWAQETFPITIIRGDTSQRAIEQEELIKEEIRALLTNRFNFSFKTLTGPNQSDAIEQVIQQAYNEADTKLVIGIGLTTCDQILQRDSFPKPTILTVILDDELQRIAATSEGTSGIHNLTYIQSPFNIRRDFEMLYEIIPFKKLAILGTVYFDNTGFDVIAFLDKLLEGFDAEYQYIVAEHTSQGTLDKVPEDADAAFIFPLFGVMPDPQLGALMDSLSYRGLPTFSLFSSPLLDLGVYAAYETEANLQRIPRRIALNALKIAEGQEAANLPVEMPNFTEDLIINMETVNKTKLYPSWDLLAQAIMINVNKINTDRTLSLRSAVVEGLENNLELKVAQKETQIVEKDVALARSNYLPQLDASGLFTILDNNSVTQAFGFQGRYNLSATVNASQLILSEPALANIMIQKILLESQTQSQRQSELDIILDVTDAYLGILQASKIVELRNQNLTTTRANYNIAKAKEQVGYAGTNDVYRWESELALDNVDLNNAQADLESAKFNLNSLLNRPINEPFKLDDISMQDSVLLVMDKRLFPLINNPGDLELFSNFLVEESFQNLPELRQVQLAIAAQERSLKSQKRAYYLPSVGLSAEYSYPIDNFSFPENVMKMENNPTFSSAVSVQIPIFQGNSRRIEQQQTEVGIMQLEDQVGDLKNKLELQVRANLQRAGASFSNLELSRQAAVAATKNFEIAQDNYQQGLLNITSLIDAQNAYLEADINATNAAYTFIADFLAVERSTGYYHFLATPEIQQSFFERFIDFMMR